MPGHFLCKEIFERNVNNCLYVIIMYVVSCMLLLLSLFRVNPHLWMAASNVTNTKQNDHVEKTNHLKMNRPSDINH